MRILKSKITKNNVTELTEYDSFNFIEDEEQWDIFSYRYFIKCSCWSRKIRLDCGYSKPIIGVMLVNDYDDRPVFCNSYYISNISVSKHFRRKGLAVTLMQEFVNFIFDDWKNGNLKHDKITLEVREDNEPAKSFYYKIGFQWISTNDNHMVMDITVDDFMDHFVV